MYTFDGKWKKFNCIKDHWRIVEPIAFLSLSGSHTYTHTLCHLHATKKTDRGHKGKISLMQKLILRFVGTTTKWCSLIPNPTSHFDIWFSTWKRFYLEIFTQRFEKLNRKQYELKIFNPFLTLTRGNPNNPFQMNLAPTNEARHLFDVPLQCSAITPRLQTSLCTALHCTLLN